MGDNAANRLKHVSPLSEPMMSVPNDEALRVLAQHVGERLRQGRDHLVTAESCTGGWIAKCVTDIAGSSDWFDCGMAAYSYEAKQALLGVRPRPWRSTAPSAARPSSRWCPAPWSTPVPASPWR